jgi:P-type Ca2+ transporter type 2C
VEGLSSSEAKLKLREYGLNKLEDRSPVLPGKIFLRQLKGNFLLYVLTAAAIISLMVDKHTTSYTIFGVVVIIIITSFVQEFKAEKAIKALENMLLPHTTVIRDGKIKEILSSEIVPGDIISLKTGERIPADCVVVEQTELKVDEAVLTGESKEVKKIADLGESIIYMGTFVTSGKCLARVTDTGMKTEFGKIASMISSSEKEMPLQAKVNKIAKYMAMVAILASIINGTVLLLGYETIDRVVIIEVLIVVIALAVSAIPEGLPLVLTTTLATGAYRMAKKNAVVNRMSVIETLGETTVICSDKTGTITKGEMSVTRIFANDSIIQMNSPELSKKNIEQMTKAAVICNDTAESQKGELIGSPTEKALILMAQKVGFKDQWLKRERISEIPFSSDRKRMSVLVNLDGKFYTYTKGAAEIVLDCCSDYLIDGEVKKLGQAKQREILGVIKTFNDDGLRTMALAYREDKQESKLKESDLVFIGLAGIEDPPREEVYKAIEDCRSAGIKVKIITGDNLITAMAIARKIDIEGDGIEGEALDSLNDKEIQELVGKINVFARVKPEHKVKIVKALKKKGEIVTMTGDGVNDAPALKEAQIGVAMGKGGSDVSRGVADITLKDDNFSTIVSAVAEGRTIFGNIKRFVAYQLSINFAQILIITIGSILGLPLVLLALQVLFINLITDVLPSISIGLTPPHEGVMKQNPRPNSDLLDGRSIVRIIVLGSVMVAGTLSVYIFFLNHTGWNVELSRSIALLTLILFVVANSYNFRSLHTLSLKTNPWSNKYLVYSTIITLAGAIIITSPPLNKIFETVPMGKNYWMMAVIISFSVILISDLLKTILQERKQ